MVTTIIEIKYIFLQNKCVQQCFTPVFISLHFFNLVSNTGGPRPNDFLTLPSCENDVHSNFEFGGAV